ncbi:hypothetical protein CKO38_03645 [Rhodospirillum rubrum]|uniref:DUF167 domain-containing protein n=1 Tax=Rhodospirillum rubrum TaxID=1085 RepID=UPI001905C1EB|nr:DUF167 family protein [Rhodospirillum rubrum]MBK1663063.1 hypothetical protein [Rhodospirillum rubrum]MBK1675782.1 hypothetical protein [Rhodospirillum rubrum]
MSEAPGPLTPCAGGLRLALRLTPKAGRDGVSGVVAEADGSLVVKASVTAVPEDGKANAALLKLLSRQWKLPRSSLAVVHGQTDRRKVIEISGEPALLTPRLVAWVASLPRL